MAGAYCCHLDQLALDEFDPVVLVQDPRLAHAMVVVNGKAPAGKLLHARLHGKDLLWFARLIEEYTRIKAPNLYVPAPPGPGSSSLSAERHTGTPVLWTVSGSRGSDSRCCRDRDERGEGHLNQVEDHEGRNTLRQGRGDGLPRHHGEPGGPEGIDHGEANTSPEQARPQSPPAGGAPRRVGGEARHGCGDRGGGEGSPRGAEDYTKPTLELGEDRHADGSDEQVDRLRERPVTWSEQEPGEDDRQNLQGEGYRREGQRYGHLGRHGRHRRHQRRAGYGGGLQRQPFCK